jgi:hypothetical protein
MIMGRFHAFSLGAVSLMLLGTFLVAPPANGDIIVHSATLTPSVFGSTEATYDAWFPGVPPYHEFVQDDYAETGTNPAYGSASAVVVGLNGQEVAFAESLAEGGLTVGPSSIEGWGWSGARATGHFEMDDFELLSSFAEATALVDFEVVFELLVPHTFVVSGTAEIVEFEGQGGFSLTGPGGEVFDCWALINPNMSASGMLDPGLYVLSGMSVGFAEADFLQMNPYAPEWDGGEGMYTFQLDLTAQAVPEPSTLTLLGIGLVAILRRRSRCKAA